MPGRLPPSEFLYNMAKNRPHRKYRCEAPASSKTAWGLKGGRSLPYHARWVILSECEEAVITGKWLLCVPPTGDAITTVHNYITTITNSSAWIYWHCRSGPLCINSVELFTLYLFARHVTEVSDAPSSCYTRDVCRALLNPMKRYGFVCRLLLPPTQCLTLLYTLHHMTHGSSQFQRQSRFISRVSFN